MIPMEWTLVRDSDRLTAVERPGTRRLGWLATLALGLAIGALAVALISRTAGAWIAAWLLCCIAAFPTCLWLGMRRSRYGVVLDFRSGTIAVDETRSFDRPLHFESTLDALDASAEENRLVLRWKEEPGTAIVIPLGNARMAEEVAFRVVAVARGTAPG